MTEEAEAPRFWDLQQYKRDTAAAAMVERAKERKLRMRFEGNAMVLFWVSLRAVVLTILTVGLYRFWMITRLRRFYWGAIRIDGDPLEYSGRAIEKLLGFLLALVVLAVYLGAVNLALTFAGLSLAADDPLAFQAALNLSVLATIPFIFFAIYRAQRYMLARTRWRGIRFALGPGAWGYTLRALGLTLLTLLTLGLAYPYQQFRLAKYVTDRAWFGDQGFRQNGSWGELFAQWVWLYIIAGIGGLLLWGAVANPEDTTASFLGGIVGAFGITALLVAYYRYQIAAFRILWNNRSLGEARFENDLQPGRVLGIYIGGGLAVTVCTAVVAILVSLVAFGLLGAAVDPDELARALGPEGDGDPLAALPVLVATVGTYLLILGAGFAFSQVFITLRVLRAQVEGMVLVNPEALLATAQREHDRAAEAGGFADALGVDIGAGL